MLAIDGTYYLRESVNLLKQWYFHFKMNLREVTISVAPCIIKGQAFREIGSVSVLAVSLSSGVLLMLNLFGNLLVCFVIIRNQIMRTPLNYLLLNLAATDMLIGVCSLLSNMFSIVFHEAESYTAKFVLCKLLGQGTILGPCYYASSLNLAGIAYERYQAVVKPLTVKEKITKRKTVIFTVLWVLAPVEACILSFQADLDGNVSPTCVNNGNKKETSHSGLYSQYVGAWIYCHCSGPTVWSHHLGDFAKRHASPSATTASRVQG